MMGEPEEAAMAAEDEDARLEVALEAVLARYGVPLDLGRWAKVPRGADRGDLASDLADAVRGLLAVEREAGR